MEHAGRGRVGMDWVLHDGCTSDGEGRGRGGRRGEAGSGSQGGGWGEARGGDCGGGWVKGGVDRFRMCDRAETIAASTSKTLNYWPIDNSEGQESGGIEYRYRKK